MQPLKKILELPSLKNNPRNNNHLLWKKLRHASIYISLLRWSNSNVYFIYTCSKWKMLEKSGLKPYSHQLWIGATFSWIHISFFHKTDLSSNFLSLRSKNRKIGYFIKFHRLLFLKSMKIIYLVFKKITFYTDILTNWCLIYGFFQWKTTTSKQLLSIFQ